MTAYPNRLPELRLLAARMDDHTHALIRLAARVLDLPGFAECSGSISPGKHHHGTGGLQQHTFEVVNLVLQNRIACGVQDDVSEDHAFLAALFHDVGKVWDYAVGGHMFHGQEVWAETPHKRLINHVNRSALFWDQCAREEGLPENARDAVLHAILAHHAEHGSSVMPKTKLAWLLHLCDSLSAWMDQCGRREAAVEWRAAVAACTSSRPSP